jgi:hypothetical protein
VFVGCGVYTLWGGPMSLNVCLYSIGKPMSVVVRLYSMGKTHEFECLFILDGGNP